MLESIEKYKELGINDFKLRDLDDIEKIYGMKPENTPGYDELPKDRKEIFRGFFLNFFNSWGLDARVNMKPKLVEVDGDYLKFVFDYYEMVNTITVVNANGWR